MPESAITPARSTSLFLAGRPSLAARSLSASSTAYSFFGMVKLSRTSLGFLALSALSAPLSPVFAAGLAALGACAAFAVAGALAAGFAAGLAAGVFFLAVAA